MNIWAVRRVSIPLREREGGRAAERCRVLLVSGDADFRTAAARVLEGAGHSVVEAAHSGHAVLAAINEPCIHLLAAELSMDDQSGPALAERLRRYHPELRTVYFASSGTPECEGIVVRPFTREDLLAGVTAALERPATCPAS